MSMPETGSFFTSLFHIPHPEDGERKIHLNGWVEVERTSSALQTIFLRLKSGLPSILSVDSLRIAQSHLTISSGDLKDFHVQ
jgi:hypothetical protein